MDEKEKLSSPVERQSAPMAENAVRETLARLRFVMLAVLILCGGNAGGILLGVVYWSRTGNKALGVLIGLALTLLAFLCVMFLALRKLRRKRSSEGEKPSQQD